MIYLPPFVVHGTHGIDRDGIDRSAADHGSTWAEGLPGWAAALLVLGVVMAIGIVGRFLVRPVFRFIARVHVPEIFTAAALLIVIGIALLMTKVGLSPALGTFLAGVVLATSEYRHELEGDIEPFKALLLGLFFIAVGASIDFNQVAANPRLIGGAVAGLIAVKFVILLLLGRVFRMGFDQNLLFSFSLAQGGEFAFVLFSFADQQGVLSSDVISPLVAVVALTMALTPLLMLVNEKLMQPRFGTRQHEPRDPDAIEGSDQVIIAGYGRFGTIVGRLLRANGVGITVLDLDSDHVEMLRTFGQKVFYGDAARLDLLRAAGADTARVLVVAVDDPERIIEIVETARKHFPHLAVLTRAVSRTHAYELLDVGVDDVYRESFDSSIRVAVDVMRKLGIPGHEAHRRGRMFRRHDEKALRELASMRGDHKAYVHGVHQQTEELERTLRADLRDFHPEEDAAWDDESLRREFGETGKA